MSMTNASPFPARPDDQRRMPFAILSAVTLASALGVCQTPVVAQETRPPAEAPAAQSPPLPPGFITRSVTLPNGQERSYVVFIPAQYKEDEAHRWPVVVFLHGSGECGSDNHKQTTVGLPRYIASRPTRFPFITIMPQARTLWFQGLDAQVVWEALHDVQKNYRTDADRVYLTGLSMGGFATWELAMIQPDAFAAIVPICGIGPKEYASNLVNLPVWAFHGTKDKNVPVLGSREPIEALRALGAKPEYTEYQDGDHYIWDRAYNEVKLWRWLLAQRRQPAPSKIDYRLPTRKVKVWWLGLEADPAYESTPRAQAEINAEGRVELRTEGVKTCVLVAKEPLMRTGQQVEVIWNQRQVFKGELTGPALGVQMKSTSSEDSASEDTPEAAEAPGDEEAPVKETPDEDEAPDENE